MHSAATPADAQRATSKHSTAQQTDSCAWSAAKDNTHQPLRRDRARLVTFVSSRRGRGVGRARRRGLLQGIQLCPEGGQLVALVGGAHCCLVTGQPRCCLIQLSLQCHILNMQNTLYSIFLEKNLNSDNLCMNE